MSDKDILTDRLRDIEARLAELEIALANCPVDGSYERQELQSEKNDLVTQRRIAERALSALAATQRSPTPTEIRKERRRNKFVDAEIATRREGLVAWIESLERSGDWRQARLWRAELLNLREQVVKEFPN